VKRQDEEKMLRLAVHKEFQKVRYLPFCYLCGREFIESDIVDGDHVPPSSAFNVIDRVRVLKLKTHKACNSAWSVDDRKFGQLISMRRHEAPRSLRDQALDLVHYRDLGMLALENLDVDRAIWRWIKGFHAALYRAPLIGDEYSIMTPFPRGDKTDGGIVVRPIRPQHMLAVEAIKRNRAAENLDVIVANNGKLRYECVWCETDNPDHWICMFALDIYDWKDLGSHSAAIPARGCAGIYLLPGHSFPKGGLA
jgi:hypothetical protein